MLSSTACRRNFPPEHELLTDRMMLTLGSSSAIVAHNLAALGSRVGFSRALETIRWGRSRCNV